MTVEFRDRREFKRWNDAMAQKYDLDSFHQHPSPIVRYIEGKRVRRIFSLLAPGPGDSVVEVGCGAGHLLAQVPAGRTFGLDLSDGLLARAAARLARDGALVQADAERLPFRSGTWDRVYCSEVLEHVPDPAAAVAEIGRVLRPTGVAVLSVPNERLINALKALVSRCGLERVILRKGSADYAMPERMDDEWHLHSFSRRSFLGLVPSGLRVTRVEGIPFRWLPLRYVVRCEAAEPRIPARGRDIVSAPWVFDLTQALLAADLRPVRRRIEAWLASAPRRRVLDVCCGTGSFARLAPGDYLGIDVDARAIERARRRYRTDRSKRFLVADATTADLPARAFDVVIFANGLHHLSDAEAHATLATLARASAGPVVVVDPALETRRPASRLLLAWEKGDHLRPLAAQLALLAGAGLRVERHETVYSGLAHQRLLFCRATPESRAG